ncbi:MAG: FlgD immunoglobulin-like domain containing protein, partial [bacterium]
MSQNNSIDLLRLLFLAFSLLLVQIVLAEGQGDAIEAQHVLRITEELRSPVRIAIDDQGVVYVTDAVGSRINRYDSDGKFLGKFTAGSSALAIAVTAQDLLYVGDRVSGELQLFDVGGRLLKKIENGFGGFELPSDAVMDDENRLYLVDGKRGTVYIFDANGDYISSFGDTILVFPTGIAFDQKNQRLLVAEHGGLNISSGSDAGKMIHAFNKEGQWLTSFGKYGPKEGQFRRIQGMTVDRSGRIYVADTYQGVITVLSENGDFLTTVGQFGTEPGELRAPMDVALDSQNRLWVTSMNNGSLEVYDVGDIPTAVTVNPEPAVPTRSELQQNYPNPFNPGTWIPFVLGEDSYVVIHVYNEVGQLIRTIDLGRLKRGNYTTDGQAAFWDGTNSQGELVASGVYLYEIRADDFVAVRR